MPTSAELKKALVAAGIEVYRTRGDVVHVAERVRENLLMDSGIAIHASVTKVVFVVRAQRNDFPADGDDRLFERARGLAVVAVERGFREVEAQVREVLEPVDAGRRLDTWCEVQFEKEVADLQAAIEETRFILALEKAATPH
jgi:hypothetical protein